jgi:hypothetical protein
MGKWAVVDAPLPTIYAVRGGIEKVKLNIF